MTDQGKNLFLQYRGRIFGPFSLPELLEMYRTGRIDGSAQISRDKRSWIPLQEEQPAVYHPAEDVPPVRFSCAAAPRRSGTARTLGSVLQLMWNAPAAGRKLAKVPQQEFWDTAFPFALLCSFFLLQSAAFSVSFLEGNILHRMTAALCTQLGLSIIAFAEFRLMRKTGADLENLPAEHVFTLFSMGGSAVCSILLLGRTMWRMAMQSGAGWNGIAAQIFVGAVLLAALFGVVNLSCGIREMLIRELRIRPAPALYWSAFFLLQSSFLFFGSLL